MGHHDTTGHDNDEPAVPRDGPFRSAGRGHHHQAGGAQCSTSHSTDSYDKSCQSYLLLALVAAGLASSLAFAPSGIATRTLHCRSVYHCRSSIATSAKSRSPPKHTGIRGYTSFLRRGEGLNVQKKTANGENVAQDEMQDDDQCNGFDPFFVLSEGMLHAEPTSIVSWPPPMPACVADFEARLAANEAAHAYAFLADPDLIDTALNSERQKWISSWEKAKPQETIAKDGLRRDRWVPLDIPMSSEGIGEMLKNPYVQLVLSDPEQRNYWIYATGRTIFFFGSSVLSALLQINIEPDWRPWVFGTNYRREISAALKRIAMSGETKNSGDFNSATKIPGIVRVFRLFGSVFELYRRDCRCTHTHARTHARTHTRTHACT